MARPPICQKQKRQIGNALIGPDEQLAEVQPLLKNVRRPGKKAYGGLLLAAGERGKSKKLNLKLKTRLTRKKPPIWETDNR